MEHYSQDPMGKKHIYTCFLNKDGSRKMLHMLHATWGDWVPDDPETPLGLWRLGSAQAGYVFFRRCLGNNAPMLQCSVEPLTCWAAWAVQNGVNAEMGCNSGPIYVISG